MVSMKENPNGFYAIGALQVIYLVFLIFFKPYLLNFHNRSIIFNQVVGIAWTAFFIVVNKIKLSDFITIMIMTGLIGVLFGVAILGSIRLIIQAKYN